MGWFENQIEERRAADMELLEGAFVKAAGAVVGMHGMDRIFDESVLTEGAVDEILKYYRFKPVEVPDEITEPDEKLDYILRRHGIMKRDVELTKDWYKDAFGPMLVFTKEDNLPVALLPGKIRGYTYADPKTGESCKMNAKRAELFEKDAICFYRPLPQKELKVKDLILYIRSCITFKDTFTISVATTLLTIIGLIMPRIVRLLTGPVRMSGRPSALVGVAISMICVALAMQMITSIRGLLTSRLNMKVSVGVESSMMMRLIALPASFFRKFSPGELRSRASSVMQLSSVLIEIFLTVSTGGFSSAIYILQIFSFASALVIPTVIIALLTMGVSAAATVSQVRLNRKLMDSTAKESGISFGLITGVQKLKLSGAEKRGFAKWLNLYSDVAEMTYNPPLFVKINTVITLGISLFGNIVLYYLAIRSGVSQANYFAFTAAYGMVMGTIATITDIALSAAQIKPILEMAEPFLEIAPETSEGREIVTDITGSVDLDHVSFRYDDSMPYVLDDLSLKVKPGEYVAIVGKTGCGKSTLVRLLLGFEKPEKGAVYFDNKDINSLDLPSLRRKIGTVMQDAGLFQGDIYSNIVITAPELGIDEAWDAAEKAGIADDIREMPMGMFTYVSEGGGSISGGQRQRLMIARAIAPKPKLLIFDEATSALDNKTQRQVSEALDDMGCTRIVIAHRLSTIKHCDRIVVLDGGHIIEDGTYDELIEKGGFFAELVERQRLDSDGK
ncbi:MAG: ATP-binding cassette domain-containing protein [Mogibacterium sp.]|nr:ATP-binding cassette domain-containing protein [Mogibacterium sp.]